MDKISRKQSELAHSKGIRIALWNVDKTQRNMEAIGKNPDFIQTDKIRHLVKKLEKTN